MTILLRFIAALLLLAVFAVAVFWWIARPDEVDSFYTYTDAIPETPGEVLRQEPLTAGLPEGANGYRILYTTTRPDGSIAVASAVVVVPQSVGAGTRIVAYAHGTTGVREGCAPSTFDDPFPNVPGFPELLDEGWAYVGTDYVGLGTKGGHFYLVGEDAARAVLDSIRAARRMSGFTLAPEAVVWGHSQGGHSALWAGQRADAYAPDLAIRGVAAVSPATDLPTLMTATQGSSFEKIISAYLVDAYDQAYPDIDAWSYLAWPTRWLARDMASRCIETPDIFFSVLQANFIPGAGIFARDPSDGPLGARLEENVPTGPFAGPVFMAQGLSDELVQTDIQDAFAARLCAAGGPFEYRRYEGQDHISVVASSSPLTADLIDWTRARFEGRAPPATCPE